MDKKNPLLRVLSCRIYLKYYFFPLEGFDVGSILLPVAALEEVLESLTADLDALEPLGLLELGLEVGSILLPSISNFKIL